MKNEVAVIINNKVQSSIADLLVKKGVSCVGVDASDEKKAKEILSCCEKIILPFPSVSSNISFITENRSLSEYLTSENVVIGGMIKEDLKEELEKAEITQFDYFKNEAYVLKNAQLTSQGAVRLLLENTNELLAGKKVLLTGFGRIGKSLALILKSLGMKVFVAVRREEVAVEAASLGCEVLSFSTLKGTLFYYDYIFNTVPSVIFSYSDISHICDSTIYFELASSPFGAEKKDFELLGKKFVHGGALPGKYYPKAVAQNIVDFILNTGR